MTNLKRSSHFTRFLLFFSLLTSLTACTTFHQKNDLPINENEVQDVFKLVSEKERSVNTLDIEKFLDQIDVDNREYYIEQKRWFLYYKFLQAKNFQLDIQDVTKRENGAYVAKIKQSYEYGDGKKKNISYNGQFIRTPSGWKDSDIEFKELKADHFQMKSVLRINDRRIHFIAQESEIAYQKVTSFYGRGCSDRTVIKLYDNANLLKDMTKPGIELPSIKGWYEYPESIKLYIDKTKYRDSTVVIAHELVHKITLSTSTNLCMWFAEGLAIYFGNFNIWGETMIERGLVSKAEHIKSINWLEKQNIETFRDRREINRFYGVSGMVVMYIEHVYGKGKCQAILNALKKYPQRGDEGFEFKKHNQLYSQYLGQAIEDVLEVDMDAFNDKWMEWIKNYKKTQISKNKNPDFKLSFRESGIVQLPSFNMC